MKDKSIDYKKLRDLRSDKNLTQKEMAEKLNITQSAYSLIENGKRGLRTEQSVVISGMLAEKINDILKENKMNTNPNSLEALKGENEFLTSMLFLLSSVATDELFSIMYGYENKYPVQSLSFEEFLVDDHSGPDDAVKQIKDDIKDYGKKGEYPGFYKEWSDEGIEYFVGKSEEWLMNFVRKEENYDIVYYLLHCPSYTTHGDMLSAFKEMLKENPLVHKLFQYGLLEKSWHSFLWQEYLEEMKSTDTGDGHWPVQKWPAKINTKFSDTIDFVATGKKREERERIREKMRSLLDDNK